MCHCGDSLGLHWVRVPGVALSKLKGTTMLAKKYCIDCKETKHQTHFKATTSVLGGLNLCCIPCEKAYNKIYYTKNKEKIRVRSASKTARKYGAVDTLTTFEWLSILREYDGECAYCSDPFESLDHVVAFANGGANTAENVVPACMPCNQSKNDTPLEEWLLI